MGVHLLAGLPTEAVQRGMERLGRAMPIVALDSLLDGVPGDAPSIGVVLPPFAEPSLIVESWEECDFLPHCFGRPAHIATVRTFVDLVRLDDQLASRETLSSHGWGQSGRDGRTIADILVGQIESATQLVLVGDEPVAEPIDRILAVLNPAAPRIALGDPSSFELGAQERCTQGLLETGAPGRPASPVSRSARVVPPWLEVLQAGTDPAPRPDLFVYRRARPFDARRLGAWMQRPSRGLVRGKGRVWIASDPARSYGYSCAGSVHRLFPGARWWAACGHGTWPTCEVERQRVLEQWHPHFGDRRQEIVFTGVDLDVDRLSDDLDGCLVDDQVLRGGTDLSWAGGEERAPAPGERLH